MGLLAHAAAYPDCLSDDAFISFRYAGNLAAGHGLVFNPGAPAVEGYTNFLWTLILAGAMSLGLDPESASRWLGLAAALATLVATSHLARRLAPAGPAWVWALPAWLLAGCSYFVIEAVQGLETALLAALVTWGLVAAVGPRPAWGGLLLGLAALTRPEGALLFGVLALLRGAWLAAQGRRPAGSDATTLLLFTAPVATHLAFRLATYGDWLPNTFPAGRAG